MPDTEVVQINIRLWPGSDDDLIAWYRDTVRRVPHGRMAQIIRDTLRRGIKGEDDLEALRREVEELRAMVQVIAGSGQQGNK